MEQVIVNIGSSSKKYALYRGEEKQVTWNFEKIGTEYKLTVTDTERKETMIDPETFTNAVDYVISDYAARGYGELKAIAVRTVAPGDYFAEHRVVDEDFMAKFTEREHLAPLHIKPAREELERIRKSLPKACIVAASDSAQHAGMPAVARHYGLQKSVAEEYGFYRFGYHGHSVSSVWKRLCDHVPGGEVSRTIILHLGSGASITALRDGKTIDTSMGFTPLEGLVMGTRTGSFDPGIMFALLAEGKTPSEIERIVNKQSGLLGVSGESSDMRDIIAQDAAGDPKATLALDLFVYNVVKIVGSYVAALGGVDAIVFTAAIGEGAPVVRRKVVAGLKCFGLTLDEEKNGQLLGHGGEPVFLEVGTPGAKPRVFVIQTNEVASILGALREHLPAN